MESWLEKEIERASQDLEAVIDLQPKEYCHREGLYDMFSEPAVMLGGIQARVHDLLFWLKQAGLNDNTSQNQTD